MDFVHLYTKNIDIHYKFSIYYLNHSKVFMFFEARRANSLNNFLELSRRIKHPLPKVLETDKF